MRTTRRIFLTGLAAVGVTPVLPANRPYDGMSIDFEVEDRFVYVSGQPYKYDGWVEVYLENYRK